MTNASPERYSGWLGRLIPLWLFLTLGLLSVPLHGEQPEADKKEAAEPSKSKESKDSKESGSALPAVVCLDDLIRLGLVHQPSIAAARASLAATQVQNQALANIRFGSTLSHELPIRRQQSCLGVTIASAGVALAEWETLYAITRNYFSAIYAGEQEEVAKELVKTLKGYRDLVKSLVKEGNPDIQFTDTDVYKLAVNADLFQLRVIQASSGIQRALAALREALGVDPCYPLPLVGHLPLPQVVPCRDELLKLALARRSDLIQAMIGAQVVELEASAQAATGAIITRTFAAGADIHVQPIPAGVSNTTYRPGAITIEMPTSFAGPRECRVQRARELAARANVVVIKTRNLIALEVDDAYLKWREAAEKLSALSETRKQAQNVRTRIEARLSKMSGEDLIRGKTLEAQVQAQYNEALYEHALALAALERITAGGFCPGYRHGPLVLAPAAPTENGSGAGSPQKNNGGSEKPR